jgi:hypothetical protein
MHIFHWRQRCNLLLYRERDRSAIKAGRGQRSGQPTAKVRYLPNPTERDLDLRLARIWPVLCRA